MWFKIIDITLSLYLYLSRFLRLLIEETLFSAEKTEFSENIVYIRNLNKTQIKLIIEILESLIQKVEEMQSDIDIEIFSLSQHKKKHPLKPTIPDNNKTTNPRSNYTNIKSEIIDFLNFTNQIKEVMFFIEFLYEMYNNGIKGTIKLLPDEMKADLIKIKVSDLIDGIEIDIIKNLFIKYFELTIEGKSYSYINEYLLQIMTKCKNIMSEHFKDLLLVLFLIKLHFY